MTGYRLGVLHGAMVSRSRAAEAWAEADRIGALAMHEGVLEALKRIGWLVDVDDSEADVGITRWLIWTKGAIEAREVLEGTPLGYLGLLEPKSIEMEDAPPVRKWLERVREERRGDPEPPAAGSILERLLEVAPGKELFEIPDDPEADDAEKLLVSCACYLNVDQAIKEGNRQLSAEWRDDLRVKVLRAAQDIRRCDDAWARVADLERQLSDKRSILEEWGIDPATAHE